MGNEKLRIAVVSPDKCKPIKCNLECKIYCPVVRMGKICIDVKKKIKRQKFQRIYALDVVFVLKNVLLRP